MVALLMPAKYSLVVIFSHRVQEEGRQYLTRRVVRQRDKHSGRAVRLGTGVEDEFVSRDAHVTHRASHIVRRTIDDEVAEEGLALPESAVERVGRVQLVESIEEVLLGVGEEFLQVRGCALGG